MAERQVPRQAVHLPAAQIQHGLDANARPSTPGPGRARRPTHCIAPPHQAWLPRRYKSHLDRWSRGQWDLFQELLQTLRSVADKHRTTIANVAVAWVLHQLGPDGGWVILGVRDASHLEEHKALRDVTLDEIDAVKIAAVLARGAAPRGDIWSYERGAD